MRTLRSRLGVALAGIAGVSVLVTALVTFGLVSRYSKQEAFRQLRRDAAALVSEEPGFEAMRRFVRGSGGHIAVVGPGGRLQTFGDPTASRVATALGLERASPRRGAGATSIREGTVDAGGSDFAYVVASFPARPGSPRHVVLARPVSVTGDFFRPVFARVLVAGALAVAVAFGVSALLAGRLSRGIRRLSHATDAVAAGDLSARVPVEGDDEVAHLGRSFNDMTASLAEARRRERELLAGVSHELRTPITAIRGYVAALTDGTAATGDDRVKALSVIDAESARLERLVADVVDLERLGAGQLRIEPDDVDLAGTLGEAADAHATQAYEAGIALEAVIPQGLRCRTDASRVRQIVSNLVENALRVTPEGGTVRIAGRREDGAIRIEVADTGPGIAAADVPHAFERSYLWKRYRGERPVGTGFGLAIVRSLVDALGGRIEVHSEPGEGTTFTLTLPANAV